MKLRISFENALKEFRELRENHRKAIRTTQVDRAMRYFTQQLKMEEGKAELLDTTAEQNYQRERLEFLEDVNTIFANVTQIRGKSEFENG